jgi:quercetin dioxygenase-like cupin family protein
VRHWTLREIATPSGTRSPVVLHSKDGAERAVLIELRAGEALGEHQVTESGLLVVIEGAVRVDAGRESVNAGPGELFHFEPGERHAVSSENGGRVLLFLAPWPGEGHYRGDRPVASRVSSS